MTGRSITLGSTVSSVVSPELARTYARWLSATTCWRLGMRQECPTSIAGQ